jgi:signal transduction histidine kinase
MRLAEFVLRDMESILREWEAFAATQLPAAIRMTPLALRDHAKQILMAVAKDLSTPQTRQAQADKSKGRAPELLGAPETAAETHAVLRARSGFDINQLVAEYRALRASVLRRWMDACSPGEPTLEDVVRFNEAIDQAIAESLYFFTAQVDQVRNLLLGMLGHDMRSPLTTIQATASYLSTLNAGEQVSAAAARLTRSSLSMKSLLDDLVDFNRTQLGLGISISPADADLAALFGNELDQLRGAYPSCRIELNVVGDCHGRWDGPRLQQTLRNLVTNAIKYGAAGTAVLVAVTGEKADVQFEVTNYGPAIEPSALGQIFDPLKRGPAQGDAPNIEGLGLGLFIVSEVTQAHGGQVSVRSSGGQTVFAVRLPRYYEGVTMRTAGNKASPVVEPTAAGDAASASA